MRDEGLDSCGEAFARLARVVQCNENSMPNAAWSRNETRRRSRRALNASNNPVSRMSAQCAKVPSGGSNFPIADPQSPIPNPQSLIPHPSSQSLLSQAVEPGLDQRGLIRVAIDLFGGLQAVIQTGCGCIPVIKATFDHRLCDLPQLGVVRR